MTIENEPMVVGMYASVVACEGDKDMEVGKDPGNEQATQSGKNTPKKAQTCIIVDVMATRTYDTHVD